MKLKWPFVSQMLADILDAGQRHFCLIKMKRQPNVIILAAAFVDHHTVTTNSRLVRYYYSRPALTLVKIAGGTLAPAWTSQRDDFNALLELFCGVQHSVLRSNGRAEPNI